MNVAAITGNVGSSVFLSLTDWLAVAAIFLPSYTAKGVPLGCPV